MLKLRVKKAFCNSMDGIVTVVVECREIVLDEITTHHSYLLFAQLNKLEEEGGDWSYYYMGWDYRPVVELKEKLERLNFQDCTQNINFWETVMAQIPGWEFYDHGELKLD